ncbi:MAG: flagellar basal body-associated FliL family protein [Rhodospirillales bacterium]|nr:flagellar basal body-associated FliL family protein [Rhodospirillales bacterium]
MIESNGAIAAAHAAGAAADEASEVDASPGATACSVVRGKLRLSRLRWPIAAQCGMVVLLVLAPALLYLVLSNDRSEVGSAYVAVPSSITYHQLPEITADLKTSHRRTHYVQLAAVIEVAEDSLVNLQAQQALIIADVQIALRDLHRQDLSGAAGVERLRGMVTSIVARHIPPAGVHAVLFTKFLVD